MLEEIIKKTNFNDLFIIIISSIAIVFFWRGIWNLTDKYLFPNNFILSQTTSIFLALVIMIIMAEYRGKKNKQGK